MATASRPVLRYHGGKWRLAPWIISHFPAHRTYVEPFGGAGSVLLRKPAAVREVYNDLDEDVVNLFRVLRDGAGAERLTDMLRLTPFSRTEFEDAYEPTTDVVERARRLVVRSFMGFGSSVFANHATGFRDYTKDCGKERFPARDWARYPDCLSTIVDRLRNVIVDRRNALEVIPRHDSPATLYYVDPPYVLSTRSNNRGVRQKYEHELNDDDHRAIAAQLHAVTGFVVISGYQCPLYVELYPSWRRVDRRAMADGANPRTESLWLNTACSNALTAAALSSSTDGGRDE